MFKKTILKSSAVAIAAIALQSGSANAAGFEKSNTWSAEAVAQGSAVVGTVKGAESLYFNPSGLASTSPTAFELSAHFSPTFSKFSGANPLQNVGSIDGESSFTPVSALFASYKVNNQLGIGVGVYAAGGTKSKFENLDYSNASVNGSSIGALFTAGGLHPTVETNLSIIEASIGAAYEIAPGFRFGAAWRPTMVKSDFSTVTAGQRVAGNAATTYVANVHIRDISKTEFGGFRIGTQYENETKSWGVGASYRSNINFTAEGDQTADVSAAEGAAVATAIKTAQTGKSSITNAFPQQINIGGYLKLMDTLRLALEYDFTEYAKNKGLVVTGTLNSTIVQNWKNQNVYRIGFEYTGMGMPLRMGYALTSQVTPSDRARSTFASPGKGHAIAIGTGMTFSPMIDFNVAAEYAFASGKGHNIPEVAADYENKSHAYVAHLSGNFHF